MFISDYVRYHAAIRPQSPMLLQEQGDNYSFSRMVYAADKCAELLQESGVARGERIAVLAQNSAEHIILMLAASEIGAVLVPLNYRLAAAELLQIIEDCQAKLLLAHDEELGELNAQLEKQLPATTQLLPPEAIASIAEESRTCKTVALRQASSEDPNTVVLQLYTSGTTGKPKGVQISHHNLITLSHGAWSVYKAKPGAGTVDLLVAPFFHIGGMGSAIIPTLAGGAVILHKQFNPMNVVDAIEQNGVNSCFMVPAMIQAILTMVPDVESRNFSSIKQIFYGASPISPSLLEQAMNVFQCDFYQAYGMTETTGAVVYLTAEDHLQALQENKPELLQSCGRACMGSAVKIIDGSGEEVEPGATGEIAIYSPLNTQGYWQRPEETEKTLRDGWIHTGDAGYMDEDGYIFIRDRIKDMVVTGGENVYPVEVEKVLAGHPAIVEAAVIGVPDKKYGEALLAVCVVAEGASFDPEAIIEYCREHIAGYKVPRQYEQMAVLPRNPSGKLLKTELRKTYWESSDRQVG